MNPPKLVDPNVLLHLAVPPPRDRNFFEVQKWNIAIIVIMFICWNWTSPFSIKSFNGFKSKPLYTRVKDKINKLSIKYFGLNLFLRASIMNGNQVELLITNLIFVNSLYYYIICVKV